VNPITSNGYLLDTSILSALAPDKPAPPSEFAAWLRTRSDRLFIPCIAVAEVEQGICKLRRAGGAARADQLADWVNNLIERYADRVLPLDAAACRMAGRLADTAIAIGRHPGFPDVVIAALAQQAGLIILTRNVRHFIPLGVASVDPFEQLPD
jgi:predicted nucleic acid-binding protein